MADRVLIAVGEGGPGDPLRYLLHPLFVCMVGEKVEIAAWAPAFDEIRQRGVLVRGMDTKERARSLL